MHLLFLTSHSFMPNFRSNAPLFLLCSTLLYTLSAANHEISLLFSTNPIAVAVTNSSQPILESEGGEFGLKFRSLNANSFLLAIVYQIHDLQYFLRKRHGLPC